MVSFTSNFPNPRQTKGSLDLVSSTRSVGMTLARPFKGAIAVKYSRRVAMPEPGFNRRYATHQTIT